METANPTRGTSRTDAAALAGKYLTFRIADEEYGLEIMRVQEIIGMLPVTAIPRVPPYVRGVVNLRGRIVPTIDLRSKFGMAAIADSPRTCIVVVEVGGAGGRLSLGLIVDEVAEVVHIAAERASAAGQFAGNLPMEMILGVGVVNESMKMLLDVDQVVSFEEASSLHQKAPAPRPS